MMKQWICFTMGENFSLRYNLFVSNKVRSKEIEQLLILLHILTIIVAINPFIFFTINSTMTFNLLFTRLSSYE